MARVVVVGGGFGGLASAARLAKLGHQVTLVEARKALGGALRPVEAEGYQWDAAASYTLLPAVTRDLFRKSGRPLEKEVELVDLPVIREHRFQDGTSVRLPGGTRSAQYDALDGLQAGHGKIWCDYVSSFADVWDTLRREYLERPFSADLASKQARDLLSSRESLARRVRKRFRDERLRLVATYPFLLDGHDARNVPAWNGVTSYVEQNFGAWTVPGGMSALADALTARLTTRKVTVLTGTHVNDLVVREGRAVAVDTVDGEVEADVVVCAIDPRRLSALRPYVERTMPAIPPVTCHLGLSADVPDLAPETVFHGDPLLVVRAGGQAPKGGRAWTVMARGKISEDVVTALVRRGLDVRDAVQVRRDRTPRALVEEWGGSPSGVLWQGRSTLRNRLGPTTPIAGVYAAGAHATPGAGLHYVGLSAALVAQAVGPA